MVEGGKKDPSVRRHELLIKSGLAEVCCFAQGILFLNPMLNFILTYLHVIRFCLMFILFLISLLSFFR